MKGGEGGLGGGRGKQSDRLLKEEEFGCVSGLTLQTLS